MNAVEYICLQFPEKLTVFLHPGDLANIRSLNSETRTQTSNPWISAILTNNPNVDRVARRGDTYVIRILRGIGIHPTVCGANWAALHGHLEMVRYLRTENIHVTSHEGANWAAMNGHLDVMSNLRAHGINVTTHGANLAAWQGKLEAVRDLGKHGIYPTVHGANWAAGAGHFAVVRELRGWGIYANYTGVREASLNGHREMVDELGKHGVTL